MKLDDLVDQPEIRHPENQTRERYESENPAHPSHALTCAIERSARPRMPPPKRTYPTAETIK
jgi:hypothetical protein